MKPTKGLLYLGLLLAITISGWAQSNDQKAYQEGYQLVLEERWSEARETLQDMLDRYPESDWRDDARFWMCFALDRGGQELRKSFTCYSDFIRMFPESEWVDDAQRNLTLVATKLAQAGMPEYRDQLQSQKSEQDFDLLRMLVHNLEDEDLDRAVNLIITRFDKENDPRMKSRLLMLMTSLESPAANDKLRQIVLSNEHPNVRVEALESLSHSEYGDVIPMMVALAKDQSAPLILRARALQGLSHREEQAAVEALANLVPQLQSRELKQQAIDSLSHMEGPVAFEKLLDIYRQSDDFEVKATVLSGVGHSESAGAIDFLREVALNEKNAELAMSATRSLGHQESPLALAALQDVMNGNKDPRVAFACLHAIAHQESPQAFKLLTEFYESNEQLQVKSEALQAIAHLEVEGTVDFLVKVAKEETNYQLKRTAISALGHHDSPKAAKALLDILEQQIEGQ